MLSGRFRCTHQHSPDGGGAGLQLAAGGHFPHPLGADQEGAVPVQGGQQVGIHAAPVRVLVCLRALGPGWHGVMVWGGHTVRCLGFCSSRGRIGWVPITSPNRQPIIPNQLYHTPSLAEKMSWFGSCCGPELCQHGPGVV